MYSQKKIWRDEDTCQPFISSVERANAEIKLPNNQRIWLDHNVIEDVEVAGDNRQG